MDLQNIAIVVLVGLISGWLASFVVGGRGIVRYLLSGVIGSLVGTFVLSKLGVNLGISNVYARDVVTATLGAIIVVVAAKNLK